MPCPPALPPGSSRRQWLAQAMAALGACALPATKAWALPPRALQFPRDFGSHPQWQTEWWYITGHAQTEGRLWGFQLTFFRSRVATAQGLQSALAAKQLLFAHAALCDVQGQRLLHDQRMARAGLGLAEASEADTAVHIADWRLERLAVPGQPAAAASRYRTRIVGAEFGLDLQFDTTQPLLLQGQAGLSRKGPDAAQASYYYSQPQLAVSGRLTVQGRSLAVQAAATPANRAWMDHEVSDALLHPEAVGWDWLGMNLDNGSALTAFQLRRRDGTPLWTGGSWRAAGQAQAQVFAPGQLRFTPLRWWTSPRTQARYPVAWLVDTPLGRFEVQALVDAQELDSRASTGTVYWEGLSELLQPAVGGAAPQRVGRGYLEMTGYANALQL